MRIYAAPMEGITGYVFRNAHHQVFPGADRYYSPFLSPGSSHKLTAREKNDILPEHNRDISVIPQILTNHAEDFLWVAEAAAEFGYGEVNLNLGCPSGTVTAKGKGAGFLAAREELDRFFDKVFHGMEKRVPGLKLSVKTRLGVEQPEEFYELIRIYNRYPICEIIVHPRVRSDFYKGLPRMEVFRQGLKELRIPVCYNGNLFSADKTRRFMQEYSDAPNPEAVMLGRGMVASPWIPGELRGQQWEETEIVSRLRTFHEQLLNGYQELLSGDRNVLFKMKELWYYLGQHFPDSPKELKKIKKAQKVAEYRAVADALLVLERFHKDVKLSF